MNKNNLLPRPANQADNISHIKTAVRRWGLLCGVLGLILAAAGVAIVLWQWVPQYDAKRFVRIDTNRDYTELAEDLEKRDPREFLGPLESELVLQQLLLDPEISKRPEVDMDYLKGAVTTTPAGGDLYAIVFRDPDPDFGVYAVKQLSDRFIEYQENKRNDDLENSIEACKSEIGKAEGAIETIKADLIRLNKDRMTSSTGGDTGMVDTNGLLRQQFLITRFNNEIALRKLEAEAKALQDKLDSGEFQIESGMIEERVNSSQELYGVDQAIRSLQSKRRSLSDFGRRHPDVVELDRQITQLQTERQALRERALNQAQVGLNYQEQQRVRANLTALQSEIARYQQEINGIDNKVAELADEFTQANDDTFTFNQTLQDQQRAFARLDRWTAKLDRFQSMDASDHHVEIPAGFPNGALVPPTEPVEKYPWKLLAIVVLAGLALPFGLAIAWELRFRRISEPDQIVQQLPVELLGEIADLPARSGPSLFNSRRMSNQLKLYEESVDNLNALLTHSIEEAPQVIAITSAASNEGKTTLASQLAISISRTHFGRTLVIDADLRSPSQHRLFEIPLEPGLVDVLSCSDGLDDAVSPTGIENLDLLAAGKIRCNPQRYFSSHDWQELLNKARENYDRIIVDTPPILAASESIAISKPCDCTLVCVMRDISRADSVRRACQRLESAGINVAGCAFGGIPQYSYANKYGSYGYNLS